MPEISKLRGGKRPGAGRPPSATVRIFATVRRSTAETLERIAKANGFERRPGSTSPFFGRAIDTLAESVTTEEPEYLKLARAARA